MALIAKLLGQLEPEDVVEQFSPIVLAHLKRIFGPKVDVDDVFQAVFVEVLRSLPVFRGKSKLRTWIHRITLNVAYQEMRMTYRDKARTSIDDVEEPASEADVEADLVQQQRLTLLYAGLETLDPKKRMAVVLHDIEGLTLKEISEHLGKPLQTVASQVRTGRQELATYLVSRGMERNVSKSSNGEASGQ